MKNKLKLLFIFLSVYLAPVVLSGQTIPDDSLYLSQAPPTDIPKIFNLPVASGFIAAERIAVSNDNKEIYYTEFNGYPPTSSRIKCFKYFEGKWNGPSLVFDGYGAPGLSPDNQQLYLESGWTASRNGTGWNNPYKLWNTSKRIHYLQCTDSGRYYLNSDPVITANGDVSKLAIDGADTAVVTLGLPVNSPNNGVDFFIQHDETFLIVAIKKNGKGNLYISYRKNNGSWTNPKYMGDRINAPDAWQYGPCVTSDNKYLFFSRYNSSTNDYKIFWVRIDKIIDSLHSTNTAPYVNMHIPDRIDSAGCPINYKIPDSTFIDDEGNNTLTYSAMLSDGNPLPAGLLFNNETCTFSGIPNVSGTYNITVTATDTCQASTSCTFNLKVILSSEVKKNNGDVPCSIILDQNYPNPFNMYTTLRFSLPGTPTKVKLVIFNQIGQKILSLEKTTNNGGDNYMKWDGTDGCGNAMSSGVYYYKIIADGYLRDRYNINMCKKMILIK